MTRAFVTCIVLATTLLVSCGGGTPTSESARIVAFTASGERITRNSEITLLWQAANAGVQEGLPSCELTRRFGSETTETPVAANCTGGMTEVPPAPLTAATVEYRLKVLKQPYDASDPYLSETRSIVLDPVLYASRAGGTGAVVEATSVGTLPDGSAIVGGSFYGTATFGATTYANTAFADGFVARVEPDGSWAWATRASAPTQVLVQGVSALADGSAIVTGTFEGTATFGATSLTSAGGFDAFVARVDPDGSWAWATHASSTGNVYGQGVSTLADGSAIVAGMFSGTATFGDTMFGSPGGFGAYVARTNPDGTWAWARSAISTTMPNVGGVSALGDGSAIITGYIQGSAAFGATTLTSSGVSNVFVAKTDPDGTWVWASRAASTEFASARGIATLPDGSAIITGYFMDDIIFGAATLAGTGTNDVFVARVEPDGSWASATGAGGTGYAGGHGISPLADGSAIITGTFDGTATFGATTLTTGGSGDVFVARVEPDGTWAWANRAGSAGDHRADAVGALADGTAIVAGFFRASIAFGATELTSAGLLDAFVAQIGADGAW